jgi:cytoskeleton protein RodZ
MTDTPDRGSDVAGEDASAGTHDALAAREDAGDAAAVAPPKPATAAFAVRRAELGLSLEDVANQLKFAPRQIEALESADFGKLPGGTFARGMLRSYARLLKLDPEPVLAQLVAAGVGPQAGPEQAVSLRTPIPFSEGGNHVNLIYAALSVVLLAIVAYFAFEWYQERGASPKLAFVSPQQDAAAADPAREAVEPPATFASAGSAPVPETTPRVEDKRLPLAPGRRRIVLAFDKESWVEIKAGNGELLLSQMNAAGTERVVEGAPPFLVTIGNAPNVRVTYNELPVDLRPHFKVDVARLTLN